MVTVRVRRAAALLMVAVASLVVSLGGCSQEQQDWRAAERRDSTQSYGQFIERHPDSELVKQARTRIAQLAEDRDWNQAGQVDTSAAYEEFLARHPAGKWAQEARIRMQNFALGVARPPGVVTPAAVSAVATPGRRQAWVPRRRRAPVRRRLAQACRRATTRFILRARLHPRRQRRRERRPRDPRPRQPPQRWRRLQRRPRAQVRFRRRRRRLRSRQAATASSWAPSAQRKGPTPNGTHSRAATTRSCMACRRRSWRRTRLQVACSDYRRRPVTKLARE